MFKKGTILYSIFNNKCPRCQEGDFFKYKASYNINKVITLHEYCPKCKFKYMIEPSFFFGAMYVNYGLAVAQAVAIFIIAKVFCSLEMIHSFIAVVIVSLITTPISLRLSRIIYINMFVSFDKTINESINNNKKKNIKTAV